MVASVVAVVAAEAAQERRVGWTTGFRDCAGSASFIPDSGEERGGEGEGVGVVIEG